MLNDGSLQATALFTYLLFLRLSLIQVTLKLTLLLLPLKELFVDLSVGITNMCHHVWLWMTVWSILFCGFFFFNSVFVCVCVCVSQPTHEGQQLTFGESPLFFHLAETESLSSAFLLHPPDYCMSQDSIFYCVCLPFWSTSAGITQAVSFHFLLRFIYMEKEKKSQQWWRMPLIPVPQHWGGRGTCISISSRPAKATQRNPVGGGYLFI